MEIRYTSIQRKPSHEALPNGKIRIYYDEIESTETASHRDEDSGEETEDTYPVYLYRVVDADALVASSIIVALIRAEYSADDELAIQRQRDDKPQEYNEYNAYAEWCKAYAACVVGGYTLDTAKGLKVAELGRYDASDAVNEFYINGNGTWLSPNRRNNLKSACESLKEKGEEVVPFMGMTIPVDTALEMLSQIESYAATCALVTENHAATIMTKRTIKTVESYDFTTGYPAKLSF